MRAKLLVGTEDDKTWAVIFDSGEEAMAGLVAFAKEHSVKSAHFTAIGAFSKATLGYFDWEAKEYLPIFVDEQVEVVSLIGDIALQQGEPKVHAHATLGKRGGVTAGGHFLEGFVRPTLEIILSQSPQHLERQFDPQSGIALIRI